MKAVIKTIHRSSVTGRLVTKAFAKSHPRITETQRVRVPLAPKRKK